MSTINAEHFTKALSILLDETFENVHGFYLHKNTSLFETLADISAEQASRSVSKKCPNLAAQVKHIVFYLEVLENSVRDPNYPKVDWDEIWRTVKTVNEEEWRAIQSELRNRYERIKILIQSTPEWRSEAEIGGAIAIIAHTAYHLGGIRQALCVICS